MADGISGHASASARSEPPVATEERANAAGTSRPPSVTEQHEQHERDDLVLHTGVNGNVDMSAATNEGGGLAPPKGGEAAGDPTEHEQFPGYGRGAIESAKEQESPERSRGKRIAGKDARRFEMMASEPKSNSLRDGKAKLIDRAVPGGHDPVYVRDTAIPSPSLIRRRSNAEEGSQLAHVFAPGTPSSDASQYEVGSERNARLDGRQAPPLPDSLPIRSRRYLTRVIEEAQRRKVGWPQNRLAKLQDSRVFWGGRELTGDRLGSDELVDIMDKNKMSDNVCIIENITPALIGAVGSHLDLPPQFFVAHAANSHLPSVWEHSRREAMDYLSSVQELLDRRSAACDMANKMISNNSPNEMLGKLSEVIELMREPMEAIRGLLEIRLPISRDTSGFEEVLFRGAAVGGDVLTRLNALDSSGNNISSDNKSDNLDPLAELKELVTLIKSNVKELEQVQHERYHIINGIFDYSGHDYEVTKERGEKGKDRSLFFSRHLLSSPSQKILQSNTKLSYIRVHERLCLFLVDRQISSDTVLPFLYLLSNSVCGTFLNDLESTLKKISFEELREPDMVRTNSRLHDCREDLAFLREVITDAKEHLPDGLQQYYDWFAKTSTNSRVNPFKNYTRMLEQIEALEKLLMDSFQLLLSSVTVQDSQISLRQGRRATLITSLAFIYALITVVTGIFGMNIKKAPYGFHWWTPLAALGATLLFTLLLVMALKGRSIRRRWNGWRAKKARKKAEKKLEEGKKKETSV
ncbi:hypothetical protein LTR85_010413 [Meristemomyces frigidus]|nr:hypothetical protein LTR85_010413 [Meristemomyces frigidus]